MSLRSVIRLGRKSAKKEGHRVEAEEVHTSALSLSEKRQLRISSEGKWGNSEGGHWEENLLRLRKMMREIPPCPTPQPWCPPTPSLTHPAQ